MRYRLVSCSIVLGAVAKLLLVAGSNCQSTTNLIGFVRPLDMVLVSATKRFLWRSSCYPMIHYRVSIEVGAMNMITPLHLSSRFSHQSRGKLFSSVNAEKSTATISNEGRDKSEAGDNNSTISQRQQPDLAIPYPKSLSPSSAKEFIECPQSYLFQYLWGIKLPPNDVLVKGSMCHQALEKLFELEPKERTLENLLNLFRVCWSNARDLDEYKHLFLLKQSQESPTDCRNESKQQNINSGDERLNLSRPNDADDDVNGDADAAIAVGDTTEEVVRDIDAERRWGLDALHLLENYYEMEDPSLVMPPNPLCRELWVLHNVTPTLSSDENKRSQLQSSPMTRDDDVAMEDNSAAFLVRGIVDRIDSVQCEDGSMALRIVDYKTGKAPNFKYTQAMNLKIANEAFWQLKVYAYLLDNMISTKNKSSYKLRHSLLSSQPVRILRLAYLTSENGKAQYFEVDLGSKEQSRKLIYDAIHLQLSDIWMKICNLVKLQDPTKFVHCDRSFCTCHKLRSRFHPSTVWQRSAPPL